MCAWTSWQPQVSRDKVCNKCRVGVTSEPELCITELTADDAFIILASDGVWEFIGNQEAVDIIGASKTVEEGCRSVQAHYVPAERGI